MWISVLGHNRGRDESAEIKFATIDPSIQGLIEREGGKFWAGCGPKLECVPIGWRLGISEVAPEPFFMCTEIFKVEKLFGHLSQVLIRSPKQYVPGKISLAQYNYILHV